MPYPADEYPLYDLQVGDAVVRWSPSDESGGGVELVADLLDKFDPFRERGLMSATRAKGGERTCAAARPAGANGTRPAPTPGAAARARANDWLHCDSVAAGARSNVIVGCRHISTVFSLARDGSGAIEWVLSSELPERSTFAFERPEDAFYNAHHAHQLANGNLLLMDNGNMAARGEGVAASRALEYELDAESAASRASCGASAPTSRATRPSRAPRRATRARCTSCRRATGSSCSRATRCGGPSAMTARARR